MEHHHRIHMLLICIATMFCLMSVGGAAAGAAGEAPQRKASGDLVERIRDMTPEEQVDYLTKVKSEGENTPELQFLLGVALYSSGLIDSSEAFFRKAIEMDSTYSRAYVNLGIVLDSQRKDVEAEFMYKKALEIDPEDELAYCHLGFIYHSRGLYGEAIKYYLRALEVNPNSAQAHYNLGLAFADSRIFKEALSEWERVIELEPDGVLGQTAKENVDLIRQYLETDIK
jgi:tetratricopeptide (TPR) repeat protein